jgi:hypothetical protein
LVCLILVAFPLQATNVIQSAKGAKAARVRG